MVTEVFKFAQEIGAATNEQSHGSSQIAKATTRLNELTHEINSAVEEQASGAQAVVMAMERMRELVQQFTSGSTELAASAEQMSKMSRMLMESMDRFALESQNQSRRPNGKQLRRTRRVRVTEMHTATGMAPTMDHGARMPWLVSRAELLMTKDLHIVGFRIGNETYGVPISLRA